MAEPIFCLITQHVSTSSLLHSINLCRLTQTVVFSLVHRTLPLVALTNKQWKMTQCKLCLDFYLSRFLFVILAEVVMFGSGTFSLGLVSEYLGIFLYVIFKLQIHPDVTYNSYVFSPFCLFILTCRLLGIFKQHQALNLFKGEMEENFKRNTQAAFIFSREIFAKQNVCDVTGRGLKVQFGKEVYFEQF